MFEVDDEVDDVVDGSSDLINGKELKSGNVINKGLYGSLNSS